MKIFGAPQLGDVEREVIERIHQIRDSLKYALSAPTVWKGFLRRNTLARAIQGSNSIEGYNVTNEDAVAAAAGEEPTEAGGDTWSAVVGYRNAMTYVLQLASDPHFSYNEGFIRSLHFMMLQYDFTKNPGKWRPGPIYVRDEQRGQVVYEGPPAERIPELIKELIERLNNEDVHFPVVVRAGMSHLNLVMIHPFSDGNGRMARCLQTLVLARDGILESPFCSIEEYLGRNTLDYYKVLGDVGQGAWHPQNDARPWVRFILTAHYRQARTLLRRTKEIQRVWDQLEAEIKKHGLPSRVIFALAEATMGLRVRNATYRSAAEISDAVAGLDLKHLVRSGLLVAVGEKRGRMYAATDLLKQIRERSREPRTDEDPFNQKPENPYLPGLEPS